MASTNYPEQLGDRIVNRPSRFDTRIKMGHPNDKSREIYFNSLFEKIKDINHGHEVDQWIEDTKGMSIAHLKGLFISVFILEYPYEEALENHRAMIDVHLNSKNDTDEFDPEFGFSKNQPRKL